MIEALIHEDFAICFSHEILLEYEEVLNRKYGSYVTDNFLKALQELPNAQNVKVNFHWRLKYLISFNCYQQEATPLFTGAYP